MTTVKELIQDVLEDIGVLGSGQSLTAADAASCLRRLNSMLSSWSVDGLNCYVTKRTVYTLTPSVSVYTLGSGGTLTGGARPASLELASVMTSSDNEVPIRIMTAEEWRDIPTKLTASTWPTSVYPDNAFPLNTLTFWPVPSEACSVVLYTKDVIGDYALTDPLNLPPGWEEAILLSLEVAVAPKFGRPIDQGVYSQARTAKNRIRAANTKSVESVNDSPFVRSASLGRLTNGYVL
jgi:hypothetical protein